MSEKFFHMASRPGSGHAAPQKSISSGVLAFLLAALVWYYPADRAQAAIAPADSDEIEISSDRKSVV